MAGMSRYAKPERADWFDADNPLLPSLSVDDNEGNYILDSRNSLG